MGRFTLQELQAQMNGAKTRQTNIFKSLGSPLQPKAITQTSPTKTTQQPQFKPVIFTFEDLKMTFVDFPDEQAGAVQCAPAYGLRWGNWQRLKDRLNGQNYLMQPNRKAIHQEIDGRNGSFITMTAQESKQITAIELCHGSTPIAVFLYQYERLYDFNSAIDGSRFRTHRLKDSLSKYWNEWQHEPNLWLWVCTRPTYTW